MAIATIQNDPPCGDGARPAWLGMLRFERLHDQSTTYQHAAGTHRHEGLMHLLYLGSGGGVVTLGTREWPVQPQTLIVIPAGQPHAFRLPPAIEGLVITAAQRPLEALAEVAAPDLLPHMREPLVMNVSGSPRHADALGPLFDAIEREALEHAGGVDVAGTALLLAVFVQVSRLAAARTRKAAQVDRFRALVDQHFREHLPVEWYAGQLGLTPGHLSRLCREVLAVSALDVINERVVQEAERELVYSTLGVRQIAGRLGYTDDAYFGRFFRRHTGHTPTGFRMAARQRLEGGEAGKGGEASAVGAPAP